MASSQKALLAMTLKVKIPKAINNQKSTLSNQE